MRAWQADKVAEPNQRLARHCLGGQSVSPGHNGRGTTSSHAHRGRKPPLDKVDILTELFSPVSPLCLGREAADLFQSSQRK